MADALDKAVSPIAHTHVPPRTEFPYPENQPSTPSERPPPHASTSEYTAAPQQQQQQQQQHHTAEPGTAPPAPVRRVESTPAPTRPARPASKRKHAITHSSRAAPNPPYTFDPYSDSDSSSDEEEEAPAAPRRLEHKPAERSSTDAPRPRAASSSDPNEASFSRFSLRNANFKTKGRVSKRDGRLKISVQELANSNYLAKTLGSTLKRGLKGDPHRPQDESPVQEIDAAISDVPSTRPIPKLNLVIIVIGSRGDIQPFLKIGKILKEKHGHRVRIATHPAFKQFVEQDSGLEFFSVGGDPSELMAFMVKNPGLIPSVETVRAGEIGRRRAAMSEMFEGMWRACINATDDETDAQNIKMMGDKHPFVADAIIANPPSFAHIHLAERLGIPLHIMFTFPYTPTEQFPHPLANIKNSNVDANYTNFISYPLVEMMTWQGLGDLVNRFRVKTLGLEPVYTLWAPGQMYRLKVPYTYMWSPGLVPKPADWGPEIDITGFVFLELASSFKPPEDLVRFLEAGEPPVYVGFGSIVVDDPNQFTQLIFDAVKLAGVRALVSKGWGGLGGDELDVPENIFLLENTPHDWLFPRVSAVVHHGGAGTTAIGLKCAKPTMIVPFFGDQPFWGAMVAAAKAGAHECIPYKKLTKERLAEGIKQCLTEEAKANVQKIADSIAKDGDGAENAVKSFHQSLPLRGEKSIRCSILEDRVAAWHMKGTKLRLSALAAEILVQRKILKWSDLRLIRHMDWTDFGGPGEPATGAASAILSSANAAVKGIGTLPLKMVRIIEKREKHEAKKRRHEQKKRQAAQDHDDAATNGSSPAESDQTKRPRGDRRHDTDLTQLSADPSETMIEEFAGEASGGIRKSGAAIVKAPMDLSLAVAQGFHNAPRLYGDRTVRPAVRISGFHSSLHASHDEFVYGIHDAFTGLYRQPYDGARNEGILGFFKGIGLGVGGFFLKNTSALVGPPAYLLKGVHKEIQKSKQPTGHIRRARILQGGKDLKALPEDERHATEAKVEHGWGVVAEVLEMERRRLEAGWKDRLGLQRRRKEWKETGAAESVVTAEKALEIRKKGVPLAEGLKGQKEETKVASMPRVGVLDSEAEEKKRTEGADGKVLENGRVVVSGTNMGEGTYSTHARASPDPNQVAQSKNSTNNDQSFLAPEKAEDERIDSHELDRGEPSGDSRKRGFSDAKDFASQDPKAVGVAA